jgi:hypothetical protein
MNRAHRLPPTHALLRLLQASGIDADAAYELRPGRATEATTLSPGYIGRLVPGTPEAAAYLALAVPVQLPTLRQPTPGWSTIYRLRVALEKST